MEDKYSSMLNSLNDKFNTAKNKVGEATNDLIERFTNTGKLMIKYIDDQEDKIKTRAYSLYKQIIKVQGKIETYKKLSSIADLDDREKYESKITSLTDILKSLEAEFIEFTQRNFKIEFVKAHGIEIGNLTVQYESFDSSLPSRNEPIKIIVDRENYVKLQMMKGLSFELDFE